MMAIDRSIFDKYQKTTLNAKYIDLEDSNSIKYVDDELAVIKPMTADEYLELDLPMQSKEINNGLPSSLGTIENILNNSALTATSFATTFNFFKEQITQSDFESFIDKDEDLN